LLADSQGRIFDPLGQGLNDLERRKIIFVGDPEKRIREDYLRILRFFRFHAYYGKGKPDAEAIAACRKLSKGMQTLSKERVTEEFFKIILSPKPGETIRLLLQNNILKNTADKKFKELWLNYLKKIDKDNSVILNLLALSGFSKSGTARIENALRLTNFQKKQLVETLNSLKKFKSFSAHELKLLLYKVGPDIGELTLIARAVLDQMPITVAKKWLRLFSGMERPVLPLRGQDLLDQGMKPGPDIKKALEKFERAWIKNSFNNPDF